MKLGLLADIHLGVRNDSGIFLYHHEKFFDKYLFPKLKSEGIDTLVILGDVFDRRKFINFLVLDKGRKMLFDRLKKENIKVHILAGNHDVFYRSSNELNSIELLLGDYDNITFYIDKPETVNFDGLNVDIVPWIHANNEKDTLKFIKDSKSSVMMAHLELQGYQTYRGITCPHGMSDTHFAKYSHVLTGHFHHKSINANIYYLGTPIEMTWADFQDPRGFHIFDTDTKKLTFIQNTNRIFIKEYYTDVGKKKLEEFKTDFEHIRNSYVKLVIKKKTNAYFLEKYIEVMNTFEPASLNVVEEEMTSIEEAVSEEDVETTEQTMKKYIKGLELTDETKNDLNVLMQSLYKESLSMEI